MHAAKRFVTVDVHRPTVPPAIWVTFPAAAHREAGGTFAGRKLCFENRDAALRSGVANLVVSEVPMSESRQNRLHVPRAVGLWLLPVLMVASVAFSQAFAACLPSADPAIRQLQTLVDQDAKAALRQV